MNETVFRSEEGKKEILVYYRQILKEWPVDYRSYEVTAEGRITRIIESGPEEAPPLLLLHGTSTNSASWMGDIPLLSTAFRVLAIDIPGQPGLSDERRMKMAKGVPASWLKGLMDKLKLSSVHLAGISLGGCFALMFASKYPEMVRSLTLIAPSGLAGQKPGFLFKALPLMMMGNWGINRISRIVSPGVELSDEVLKFGRLVSRNYKPVTEPIPLLRDREMENLSMPLLYFGGTEDAILKTIDAAERLERFQPEAEINILEGVGHTILGKTEEILKFLRKSEYDFIKKGMTRLSTTQQKILDKTLLRL